MRVVQEGHLAQGCAFADGELFSSEGGGNGRVAESASHESVTAAYGHAECGTASRWPTAAVGAHPAALTGLANLGDLAATCFSPLSRN